MTKSYRDHQITIAAWANRNGRMPVSLAMRESDPSVYAKTVTGQVYQDARPHARLIEDTAQYDYVELYDRQRDRIKSSVVYPVLSDGMVLLGTLVMHCDKAGFFRQDEIKFWGELLEVFAKRIALEKMKLDQVIFVSAGADADEESPRYCPF